MATLMCLVAMSKKTLHREHVSACYCSCYQVSQHHLLLLLYGGLTGFFMLNRSLVEEFRKTLCSLWQGSQTAFSPDSLFYTIWKIMPSFRLISIKGSCHHILLLHLYMYIYFLILFLCVGVISSRTHMSSCVTY